jgi:hypothetical protein
MKRTKFSRAVSLIVVLLLTLSLFPVSMFAAENEQTASPVAVDLWGADTLFRVEGAAGYSDAFVMPFQHDTYYRNGWQTVFLLDENANLTALAPVFWLGQDVIAVSGGVQQESGVSVHDFSVGPVGYTAVAPDNLTTRGYQVSFVQRQLGNPTLFVNGPDERYIAFDAFYGFQHDVLVANIGDQPLTIIDVRLENAQNIELSDSYTLLAGDMLPAFDTTEPIHNTGLLPNTTKISLIYYSTDEENIYSCYNYPYCDFPYCGFPFCGFPFCGFPDCEYPFCLYLFYRELCDFPCYPLNCDSPCYPLNCNVICIPPRCIILRPCIPIIRPRPNPYLISGQLIIETDGGTRTIELTGRAGNPRIVTTQAQINSYAGVRFVPYSFFIETNNPYQWATQTFSLYDGQLPPGLRLRPNGEIFGIPTVAGTFSFTTKVTFDTDGVVDFPPYTRQFTIQIQNNTAASVDATLSPGLTITDRVPSIITVATDLVFRIEGDGAHHALGEFIAFSLNGIELTEGVDFEVDDGSTRITIRSQTVEDAGHGEHTIAAEFRVGGDEDSEMLRAAQNFTFNPTTTQPETNPPPPPPPQQLPAPEVPLAPLPLYNIFDDVAADDWFVHYLQWAYESGLMVGMNNNLFAPNSLQTQAMFFTVLARLANVDLLDYADYTHPSVATGQWYTNAAQWAHVREFVVGEFIPDAYLARGDTALVLLRFLRWLGIDTDVDIEGIIFIDAHEMTAEQLYTFEILFALEIFKGYGNMDMRPLRTVSRAELAALMLRVSRFIEDSG